MKSHNKNHFQPLQYYQNASGITPISSLIINVLVQIFSVTKLKALYLLVISSTKVVQKKLGMISEKFITWIIHISFNGNKSTMPFQRTTKKSLMPITGFLVVSAITNLTYSVTQKLHLCLN